MGTLVFQATLGGQVNLTGPNTASTFTISVPAVTGNMITSGDTSTVTNTMLAGSIANAKLLNSSVTIGSTAISLGATSTTLDGVNIGATTPGTGAFTTLSASSTTTLSGGTANGVAYLNGSKVVTTGSALTFDGTTFKTSAAGTSVSLSQSTVNNGVAVSRFSGLNGSGTAIIFDQGVNIINSNAFELYDRQNSQQVDTYISGASGYRQFFLNGSEQMRLTSTGLGIGTSSPSFKFQTKVATNGNLAVTTPNSGTGVRVWAINDALSATQRLELQGNPVVFPLTTGADGMYFDASSGNLGLGVTPSAWTGNTKALQFGNPALWADNYSGATNIGYNAYQDTNTTFKYLQTGLGAGRYEIAQNLHRWYNAASGTAGNAITFTQAMTLDASGNLAIGTTSAVNSRLYVANSGVANLIIGYNNTSVNYFDADTQIFRTSGSTERARIDSSGNLGVGTTSPSASAIIDAQSTTKGVRFPNMTTTQKNAVSSPAAGLVVFDTTLAKLCVYSGSAWQTITSI